MSAPFRHMHNPFKPGFGGIPPLLAGRDDLLGEIQEALAAGSAHPSFTSVLLGPRGSGKTTALQEIQNHAGSSGWVVCDEDAVSDGGEEPLHLTLAEIALEHIRERDPQPKREMTSLKVGPVGVGWANVHGGKRNRLLKHALDALAGLVVAEGGPGVLLSIDEFHNLRVSDASFIASAVQRLAKRQNKPVAIVCAGLPHVEHTLLSSRGFTFFQRAQKHRIGNLSMNDTKQALRIPFEDHGIVLDEKLLCRAAAVTRGLPYAIQSLGYHLWNCAMPDNRSDASAPTEDHLEQATSSMRQDIDANVMSPIWVNLTDQSRRFLAAMSSDSGSSHISHVARRLNMSASVANTYRRRLLDEGAIIQPRRGLIEFADDSIREQALKHRAEEISRRMAVEGRDALMSDPSRPANAKCGVMLPVAQQPCIRPSGHNGRHRWKW